MTKLANEDANAFYAVINEVASEHDTIVILIDKGKPKTAEELEDERKWMEERKKITEYQEKYEGETLVFTRRNGETGNIVLLAHGFTEDAIADGLDESAREGRYDRNKDTIFFEGTHF